MNCKFFLEKTEFPRVWKLTGVFPSKNLYRECLVTSPKRKKPLDKVLERLQKKMLEEVSHDL